MGFKDTLEKLNSVDIKDLKNIDYSQFKVGLKANPAIFINIILIGLTIFAIIMCYTKFSQDVKNSKNEIQRMQGVLAAKDKFEAAKSDLDKFVDAFPKSLAIARLTDKLSDMAPNHSVRIVASYPEKEIAKPHYTVNSIVIEVESPVYKNIALFVKDIEDSRDAIRVDSWNAILSNSPRGRGNSENENLRATITISTVELKK